MLATYTFHSFTPSPNLVFDVHPLPRLKEAMFLSEPEEQSIPRGQSGVAALRDTTGIKATEEAHISFISQEDVVLGGRQ